MAFGSGAWESAAGRLGKDEGMGYESGEPMKRFGTEFVHKLAGRRAAGPAWVRKRTSMSRNGPRKGVREKRRRPSPTDKKRGNSVAAGGLRRENGRARKGWDEHCGTQ